MAATLLAFYNAPRYTGDIDILVSPEASNAQRVLSALEEFGFGAVDLTNKDFNEPTKLFNLAFHLCGSIL